MPSRRRAAGLATAAASALVALAGVLAGPALAGPAPADGTVAPVHLSTTTFGLPMTLTVSGSTPGPNPSPGYSSYEAAAMVTPGANSCPAYGYDDNQAQDTAPAYQLWDVSNADGPFTETDTMGPEQAEPGTYSLCAWLFNFQNDMLTGDHGLIAQTESTVQITVPHYGLSMRAPRRVFIGHVAIASDYKRLTYSTFKLRITAPVARKRIVALVVEPPGVRTCPDDIGHPWNAREAAPLEYRPGGDDEGIKLRQGGPFTYTFKIAEFWEGGAIPGHALACAAVYDTAQENETAPPAGLEAAAHARVDVVR